MTEREKLHITTFYYDIGNGELEKATQSYKEWIQTYPRDSTARIDLGVEYSIKGQYEQALAEFREALRLEPNNVLVYEDLSGIYITLSRFDEAQNVLSDASARKLDDAVIRENIYGLAFLRGDSATMQQTVAWAMGKPGEEDLLVSMQSDTEAYSGRLRKARELSKRAAEVAKAADFKEAGALWQVSGAMREAAFGDQKDAREDTATALAIAPDSRDAQIIAALVYARVGDVARARSLSESLNRSYPVNTVVQTAWLPTVNAQLEMNRGNAAKAVELLQSASAYELGEIVGSLNSSCMIPVYVRGEAYLEMKQGSAAATEFQKLIDHRGIVWNCWSGALAHLGLGRAYALQGDAAKARVAYQDFLALWKDADPDVPILREAKAEYVKLK